jgi:hypothetical protein
MVRASRHVLCLVTVAVLGVGTCAAASGAAAQAAPVMGRALPGASPDPSPTQNRLNSVSAASPKDAWAVGVYFNSANVAQTLILHWNGAAWSQVPSPNPGPKGDWLNSVSAVSPKDAWAVGGASNSAGVGENLILHWNGTAWSRVSSPRPSSTGAGLIGVDAISGSRAWAVGSYFGSTGSTDTLILRWNGAAWSQVPSPNPGIGGDVLNSVSATPRTGAWAVGSNLHGPMAGDASLTLHWNGTAWSRVKSPTPTAGIAWLTGVSAISRTSAWAVGASRSDNLSRNKNLALRWNGASWSQVAAPSPGRDTNELQGVSAVSGTDAWAVGWARGLTRFAPVSTVTLHWNGTAWSRVPSPNPGNGDGEGTSELFGVSALSSTDAWAVGDYINQTTGIIDTLILHWNGSTWSVT